MCCYSFKDADEWFEGIVERSKNILQQVMLVSVKVRFPKVCLDNATWDDKDGDVEKLWDCVRIQCGRGDKTNMHYLERARDRNCKKVVV